MAKVAFTPVVGDARGKVGNTVFSRAKNGATIRLRVRPTNPSTIAQQEARANLVNAANAYKALSSTNLELWRDYALSLTRINPVSGQTYHPSAISVYCELATKMRQVNPAVALPTTPPAAPFTGDDIVLSGIILAADELDITADSANAANVTTEFLYQQLASANRLPSGTGYRLFAFHDFEVGTLSPTIAARYDISLQDSVALAYRFVQVTTGLMTPIVPLGIVSVA